MILQFHPEALREYDKALIWYAERSMSAPFNFAAEVDSIVERIHANPLSFPVVHRNLRKAVIERFPFCIIFESRPDRVIVFSVAHSKRKTAYWRNRRIYP